jgi:hypothetical protein
MNSRSLILVAAALFATTLLPLAAIQTPSTTKKATPMSAAKGTFDVKLTPQPATEGDDPSFSRMTADKQFHGDLQGTGKVQMLAAGTTVKNSGGYVAMEKVTATLAGRNGTYILQHSATMDRGVPNLSIVVVPDSGTDQLSGISGKFSIDIKDGKHFYSFEYFLP